MKKSLTALISAVLPLLILGLVGIANASSITWSNSSYVSSVIGALTEDFNEPKTLSNLTFWTGTGTANLVKGSVTNEYAAPYNVATSSYDTSQYLTVPKNLSEGQTYTATFNLSATYNYLGLWWGSVDTYNTITFYKDGNTIDSYTGTQLLNLTGAGVGNTGDQDGALTNVYVNFFDIGNFDSFSLTSSSMAFEVDNVAVAKVPEPTTMLLLGFGMLGLAGVRRKIQN